MRLCSVPGCSNRHNAHGLCATHQRRLRVHGDLSRGRQKAVKRLCKIDGCGKPKDREGLCQMHAWRLRHYGDPNYKREPRIVLVCDVPNCERSAVGRGLCQLHLSRKRKGIPQDFTRPKLQKQRYRQLTRPDHPLANKRGRVYEHRMVLFDQIGDVRVPCFWCGDPLEWRVSLCVDHLDHNRHHNVSTNLVPACNGCNAGRTISNPQIRQSIYSPNLTKEERWTVICFKKAY